MQEGQKKKKGKNTQATQIQLKLLKTSWAKF